MYGIGSTRKQCLDWGAEPPQVDGKIYITQGNPYNPLKLLPFEAAECPHHWTIGFMTNEELFSLQDNRAIFEGAIVQYGGHLRDEAAPIG